MTAVHVVFQPEGKRVQVDEGSTLLSAALKAGADLVSTCGGKGTCGKCKVIVSDENSVSPSTEDEQNALTQVEIDKNVRLACFAKVFQDLTVKIPETSRTGRQRLQIEGIETATILAPSVRKIYLEMEAPTLEDPRADAVRLIDAIETQGHVDGIHINFRLLRELGNKIRDCDWKCTAILWNSEIVDLEPEDTTSLLFGYAVDVGTTKLAGYLIDLATGNVVAAGSAMNPQIPFGEDVISRLNHPDQEALKNAVVGGINDILLDLIDRTGVKGENIYEMTAVGNTVMNHIFLGIAPIYLGRSPYPPVTRSATTVDAADYKIAMNPRGKIFFLPNIAGFVGADTVGVILATEIYKKEKISIALDIGTNTEIVLGNKDRLIAVSCASGPAFEGAHVKFGMRAASGAIEKIKIDPDTLAVNYTTIDDEPPVGICGSAMIDLVAEMVKAGVNDVSGIINRYLENPRIREMEEVMEFVVVPAEESGTHEDITFSQRDVSQILLAKAAIYTGFKLLFKHHDVKKEDINELFVAGAFGSHINKESARMVGLMPEIDLDRIVIVGNGAGTGARKCLVSQTEKDLAESLSRFTEYLELGVDTDFQKVFLNANFIPYADLDEFPEMSDLLKQHGHYPEIPPPLF